jgi:hypothetical protein
VRVRSVLTDLGINTVPQIIDGENSLMDVYQKTLYQAAADQDKALLERQMNELSELIARSKIESDGLRSPSRN